MIAGVVTLDSQDFLDVYNKLSQKPDQLNAPLQNQGPSLRMEEMLKRRFVRKTLKAIIEINKKEI